MFVLPLCWLPAQDRCAVCGKQSSCLRPLWHGVGTRTLPTQAPLLSTGLHTTGVQIVMEPEATMYENEVLKNFELDEPGNQKIGLEELGFFHLKGVNNAVRLVSAYHPDHKGRMFSSPPGRVVEAGSDIPRGMQVWLPPANVKHVATAVLCAWVLHLMLPAGLNRSHNPKYSNHGSKCVEVPGRSNAGAHG